MDVRQARAFLAVAEELHFGRAAERLHMAQPPLSRLVRRLEDELGVELFDRSTRRVVLTAEGRALQEPARELLALSARMREIAQRASRGETGHVRLGFAGASVSRLVSAIARGMASRWPGVDVELRSAQLSRPGLDLLLGGGLDALIGRWDYLPAGIASLVLAHERLLLALPPGHRLAEADVVRAAELADESWIALPGGPGATLSSRMSDIARRGSFVPRIVQTAADSATQLLLVGAGAGVALIFEGVREAFPSGDVAFVRLEKGLSDAQVRLAWRAGERNPALRRLIEVSEEACAQPSLSHESTADRSASSDGGASA